jgi:hypothetical protein
MIDCSTGGMRFYKVRSIYVNYDYATSVQASIFYDQTMYVVHGADGDGGDEGGEEEPRGLSSYKEQDSSLQDQNIRQFI